MDVADTDDNDMSDLCLCQVYPRAFRRGLELALKCKGLRHVIALSAPGGYGAHPASISAQCHEYSQ